MATQQGPASIEISKVKGHAAEKNIEDGIATRTDKEGNNEADSCADEGFNAHSLDMIQISRILARRQHEYVSLVNNIHDHILEAFYKRKEILGMHRAQRR